MKKNIMVVVLLLLFTYCKNYDSDLDENLYDVIVRYQKDYPIPKINHNEAKQAIYLYKVYFWKEKKDTIILLQRSSGGMSKLDKGYGIYQDDRLYPTFIYDDNNLGTKLIKHKINNCGKNKNFYWLFGTTPSERFPPVYKYKVQSKELKLVTIDTVWRTWD